MMLKDLSAGDEFEYVTTKPTYRSGKFLVLGDDNSYLRPIAVDACRFLFSYATKKVVRHFEKQEVIKKGVVMKSQNQMGHFVGWEFGVPVTVHSQFVGDTVTGRLIQETEKYFRILNSDRGITSHNKSGYYYELIPHQAEGREPAYPVCKNDCNTAYCNARVNGIMSFPVFGGTSNNRVKPVPFATLIIDGKTIELSAETTAELKKKLGV